MSKPPTIRQYDIFCIGWMGPDAIYPATSEEIARRIFTLFDDQEYAPKNLALCINLPHAKICTSFAEAHQFFAQGQEQ